MLHISEITAKQIHELQSSFPGLGMASVSYLTLVYTFDNTMLSVLQVLCMQCQGASVPFEASSARRSNIVFQAWGRLDVSKYATRIQIHHSGSAELDSYQVRLVAASAGHQHIPVPEATPTAKEQLDYGQSPTDSPPSL